MDKKQALTQILEFLKLAKANPEALNDLSKSVKGVHLPVKDNSAKFTGKGTSETGLTARSLNFWRTQHAKSFKNNKTRTVKGHQRVLSQLKQMPKPNLPKTEMVKNGDMIEAKMKNKSKEESMNKSVLDIAKELLKAHKEDPKAFEQLTKGMAAPAMAPKPSAPKAPPAAPKTAAPKAPAMKAPAAAPKAPMMKEENCGPKMMSKEEIQADIKKEWKPKFKKG